MYTTMKKSILTISAIIAASAVMAQSEDDALRFSQTYQQGTARSAAMGGAFGALGGDLSVLATNPAGMSIYKDGEFSFTPCFGNITTNTTINGFDKEDSKFNFKMSNFGFVTSHHNGNEGGFSGFAFGMTFNRLNDFSANNRVYGRNDNSSHLDLWSEDSRGTNPDRLYWANFLPLEAQLMNIVDSTDWVYSNMFHRAGASYGEYQKFVQTVKGGINSWDFAFSGVYAEKIFFGASLGIQSVNYKNVATYSELDINDVVDFNDFDFKEEVHMRGSGINFKAGLIYKPVNFLRFGAAIHTPTFYSLTNKYYYHLNAVFDSDIDIAPQDKISDNMDYEFRFTSPFKAILSGAFIVPNYGLISVDYEYVDYTKAKYETNEEDNHDFDAENTNIKEKFKATKNLRIGIEGLVGQISLRGGYAMYGNPNKFVADDIQRQIISAGIGFRGDGFYLDFAGTYHIYNTEEYLYGSPMYSDLPSQSYTVDRNHLYIMATLGFKF